MADLFDKCNNFTRARELQEQGWYPYFKAIQSGADTEVTIDGRKLIMVGSNNYLGLTQDPRIKEAAINAVNEFGSGCTGSRFLNGTLSLHVELEEKLAEFMDAEAALVFSTGFQTNLGTISTIAGKDDIIYTDRNNHACILDGARLSFGRVVKFKHNNMRDLERLLAASNPESGKLIVTDGVFSMEGNLVDLPSLVELAKKYGARIMVDDAHSIGVFGKNGRGTAEHFGLEKAVDIVMGTFSKSFASLGGFIAAKANVIDYIKHHSRALIFSASMPPAAVASVLKALEIIQNEPERRERLWEIVRKMKRSFDELGFDTCGSESPVIPIVIGEVMDTFVFWKRLFESGVFANPAIPPAVPPGKSLIRTSYMATHTDEELNKVLDVFEKLGREFRLI
ncbi:MAG: pyridoxal phosphate-dependent aminotransferase family protein [Calditrichaeota bacterium]|nr:MAG: pyridoxal phosphate-dependent aminotransferase family protein [Calditrichota bacterium]